MGVNILRLYIVNKLLIKLESSIHQAIFILSRTLTMEEIEPMGNEVMEEEDEEICTSSDDRGAYLRCGRISLNSSTVPACAISDG